jgi:DNA-binding MarR family transcriptional regulator
MNTQLLIDNIVRQTTVLLAQLATSRGLRAPLAHVADQVFLDLASELAAQGLSRKVTADMFGLALRSYRRRVQRLTESTTERGRSLWEAVLDYLSTSQAVTRADVLKRFGRDDEATVRALLNDLCESGLVFRLGRGHSSVYRAATPAELKLAADQGLGLDELLWVLIYREGPLSSEQLEQKARVASAPLAAALERLTREQRIERDPETHCYRSSRLILMLDGEAGWEASMFDHFQAVVRTLCARLRGEGPAASTGGSTYSFDVWPGHPLEAQVKNTLQRLRDELGALWEQVEAHNRAGTLPDEYEQITVYAGQSALTRGPQAALDEAEPTGGTLA